MGPLAALRLSSTIGDLMSFHCTVVRASSGSVTLPSLLVLLSRTTSRRVPGLEGKLILLLHAKPSRSSSRSVGRGRRPYTSSPNRCTTRIPCSTTPATVQPSMLNVALTLGVLPLHSGESCPTEMLDRASRPTALSLGQVSS